MRKILVTLTSLLVITSLQSQSICGKIVNPQRDYIILKSSDRYGLKSHVDTIALEKDGSFTFSIPYNFKVTNGRLEITSKQSIPIWLNIDQKLLIDLLDSSLVPEFSGELGRINKKYLYEVKTFDTEIYNSYLQKNPSFVNYSNSRSDEYFIIMDSMTNDQILFLENSFHNSNNKIEQLFIGQRKKDIIFSNLFYKISYNDPPLEKLSFYQKRLDITYPTSFAYSDEINFNDPGILSSTLLRFGRMFFMELVFRYQETQKIKLSKDAFYDKLFSEIDKFSKQKFCNAILKASFIRDEISRMPLSQSSSLATYRRFIDSLLSYRQIRNEAQFIENLFREKANNFYALNGVKAPSCSLTDVEGNIFTLDDLKGKLIYIDVWATWCKPCIESVPQWNKLVEKYKSNKEALFITVSTDDAKDISKWLETLKKHKFKGLHFISAGGIESEFAKKFLIDSYPTNILIDKQGKIMQLKAERPETIDLSSFLQK